MSRMKTRIAIITIFTAAIWDIAGEVAGSSIWANQTIPSPPEPVVKSHEQKKTTPAETPIERSPFGMAHDFGKIKFGTKANHAFCIVNTSDVPLRIVSVRASSANHLQGKMSKLELQPSEEGKLEISIDTRYFVGRKTSRVFLILQHGDKRTETFFSVTAESIKDSEP